MSRFENKRLADRNSAKIDHDMEALGLLYRIQGVEPNERFEVRSRDFDRVSLGTKLEIISLLKGCKVIDRPDERREALWLKKTEGLGDIFSVKAFVNRLDGTPLFLAEDRETMHALLSIYFAKPNKSINFRREMPDRPIPRFLSYLKEVGIIDTPEDQIFDVTKVTEGLTTPDGENLEIEVRPHFDNDPDDQLLKVELPSIQPEWIDSNY